MDLWNQLCLSVRSARRLAVLLTKKINVGHYTQTFYSNFFSILPCLHAPSTFTISYHFKWPSPWFGVTRSAQNKTSWLYCLAHFSTKWDWNLIWCRSKLNILIQLASENYWNKGKNCCFSKCIKKTLMLTSIQTFVNWFGSNLVWW